MLSAPAVVSKFALLPPRRPAMELAAINSPSAAFVAGVVTSLHCAGMCGPLACGLMPVRGERADASTVASVYHLARLAGYGVLGALAGGLGHAPLAWVNGSALRWLPWLMVLFFVALGLRLDRHLPKLAVLGRVTWKVQAWRRGRSPVAGAAALGLVTPLLPCGPLYFVVALALLAGTALFLGACATGGTAALPPGTKPYPLKTCLVTDNALESMGDEKTFVYQGQEIRICCEPCESKFLKNPARYLSKLK